MSAITLKMKTLAGAGLLTLGLIFVPALATASFASEIGNLQITPTVGSPESPEEFRAVFSEPEDNYSFLIDAVLIEAFPQYEEDGFLLKSGSAAGTFMVYFDRSWTKEKGPSASEYIDSIDEFMRSEYGDDLEIVDANVGIVIAGVSMPASAWYVGNTFIMTAAEERDDGMVYWSVRADDEISVETVNALTEAVATFRPDANYYGSTNIYIDPQYLVVRPAEEPSQPKTAQSDQYKVKSFLTVINNYMKPDGTENCA